MENLEMFDRRRVATFRLFLSSSKLTIFCFPRARIRVLAFSFFSLFFTISFFSFDLDLSISDNERRLRGQGHYLLRALREPITF